MLVAEGQNLKTQDSQISTWGKTWGQSDEFFIGLFFKLNIISFNSSKQLTGLAFLVHAAMQPQGFPVTNVGTGVLPRWDS